MPRLNTLIEVGFCSGYGDGDYRVSSAIRDLSKTRFDELKLAVLDAVRCAEDTWRSEQAQKPSPEGLAAATSTPGVTIAPEHN